jgi:sodium-dependent dicarboxylate transporter 2/3/5
VAVVVYGLLEHFSGLSTPACFTGAVAMWMAVWWMTEAVPLAATALLPIVLFPLLGVAEIKAVTAQYGNRFIFLFMGGFMLALAIEKWNLHRRIALSIVSVSGTKAERLIGGFMLATALISMWISNTATTVMMLPIAASVVGLFTEGVGKSQPQAAQKLGVCLMLGIAYSSSIGGLATLVGTPPNVQLVGFLSEQNIHLDFSRWMLLGLPLSLTFLFIAWLLLTRFVFPVHRVSLSGTATWLQDQLDGLGPISRAEKLVAVVFAIVAAGWLSQSWLKKWDWLKEVLPMVANLDDTVIAIGGALLLFVIPVNVRRGEFLLDWPTARKLPWGVLLIFGGGYALAAAVQTTELDIWIGNQFSGLAVLPPLVIVLLATTTVVFLTEMTSNTATAATLIPILYSVEQSLSLPKLSLVLPASLAASCAFMLPAATPPNAIVIGSGYVKIGDMVKGGLWLNLVAIILVTLFCWLMGSVVLPG